MLIFKYAKEGTLEIEGLKRIAATCDVTTEGVGGAKSFFEAKANEVSSSNKTGLYAEQGVLFSRKGALTCS